MSTKQTFRFGSKYPAYRVIVQGAEPRYLSGTATIVGHEKELVAEFGEATGEFTVLDVNGEPLIDPGTGMPFGRTAEVRGYRFDSRAQQEKKGWTDEEHDRVVARVQFQCSVEPGHVWALEEALLDPPLPGWNDLSAARKVAISAELGIVGSALAYEKQQDDSSEVVERLQKKHDFLVQEQAQEEALVA